jgi:hypothetical protein
VNHTRERLRLFAIRHPRTGVLRRWMEDPSFQSQLVTNHVNVCEQCCVRRAEFQRDANIAWAAYTRVPLLHLPDHRSVDKIGTRGPRAGAQSLRSAIWHQRALRLATSGVVGAIGGLFVVGGLAAAAMATNGFGLAGHSQVASTTIPGGAISGSGSGKDGGGGGVNPSCFDPGSTCYQQGTGGSSSSKPPTSTTVVLPPNATWPGNQGTVNYGGGGVNPSCFDPGSTCYQQGTGGSSSSKPLTSTTVVLPPNGTWPGNQGTVNYGGSGVNPSCFDPGSTCYQQGTGGSTTTTTTTAVPTG